MADRRAKVGQFERSARFFNVPVGRQMFFEVSGAETGKNASTRKTREKERLDRQHLVLEMAKPPGSEMDNGPKTQWGEKTRWY